MTKQDEYSQNALQIVKDKFPDIQFDDFDNCNYPFPIGGLCERLGIEVEFCKERKSESFSRRKRTIYVDDNLDGQAATVAIARDLYFIICTESVGFIEQWEADLFAVRLLMPSDVFLTIGIYFQWNIAKLATFFGVPETVVGIRSFMLGKLSKIIIQNNDKSN